MPTHLQNLLRWPGATLVLPFVFAIAMIAQTAPEDPGTLRRVLERLDRLEQQNRDLAEQVHLLRNELALARGTPASTPAAAATAKTAPPESTTADLAERMDVQEHRLEEQAQTKVESSQHFPIRITGMALFNAFLNSRATGGPGVPTAAPVQGDALSGGASLRQTVLGLDFRGPEIFDGGSIHGFVNMDFFGASGDPYGGSFRIRTAGIEFNWANTTIMFGQDKPLIAPREPNSLAQVWVAPLTGAGNLWVWQPQARVEQRFHVNERTTVKAQAGVFETREAYGPAASPYAYAIQMARPAAQGRVSVAYSLDDNRRVELGTGFDASTTHVAGATVPTRVFALDWLARPWRKLEFSGAFFHGENVANLGGIGTGFTITNAGYVSQVHSDGGWQQVSFLATPRLTFNLFGGEQQNRGSDLAWGQVAKNQAYGANLMYRIAPNVILSFETEQARTNYLATGNRLNNHYDLALAYLF
jgi:hypothetical protein